MNGPTILDQFRNDLAKEISCRPTDTPKQMPLTIDPWLAMSLLQKAIRRGREEWALRAAATLLESSPERLWRRLCVIVFEDIGVADNNLVGLVVGALKGKTVRRDLGGEWAVARHLVQRMCWSPKCRAADDLLFLAEQHPRFQKQRLELTCKPLPQLWKCVVSSDEIVQRALALWFVIGTDQAQSDALRVRKGDWKMSFDFLAENRFPDTVVEIAREGFRKSQDILCPLLVLLERASYNEPQSCVEEKIAEDTLISGVPCWAYDMHVREGKKALALLLERNCVFAKWHASNVGKIRGARIAGNMLFRIEIRRFDKRLDWEMASHLLSETDGCYPDLTPELANEGMALLKDNLPLLNEARHDVVSSQQKPLSIWTWCWNLVHFRMATSGFDCC